MIKQADCKAMRERFLLAVGTEKIGLPREPIRMVPLVIDQGPVARSVVSANHWLNSIKTNRLSWYLTLVSVNHPSNNSAQFVNITKTVTLPSAVGHSLLR